MQKRVECWMQVLPSMPKGDIVGKYWTSNECVLMIVVFDGNNINGGICRIWGFGRKSTGGTTLKKTRATEVYREEGRWWLSDPIQISRKTNSRQICRSCKGDKPSENRGSGFHNAKNNDKENPEIAICDFAIWSQPLIKQGSGPFICMDTWQLGGLIGNSGIGIS